MVFFAISLLCQNFFSYSILELKDRVIEENENCILYKRFSLAQNFLDMKRTQLISDQQSEPWKVFFFEMMNARSRGNKFGLCSMFT